MSERQDAAPRLARGFPHAVHLPTPEGGWSRPQLDEIADWCRQRFAPGSCHFSGAWYFKREADALSFRARWAPDQATRR